MGTFSKEFFTRNRFLTKTARAIGDAVVLMLSSASPFVRCLASVGLPVDPPSSSPSAGGTNFVAVTAMDEIFELGLQVAEGGPWSCRAEARIQQLNQQLRQWSSSQDAATGG